MTYSSYSIFKTRFGKMGIVWTEFESEFKINRIFLPNEEDSVENLINQQFVNLLKEIEIAKYSWSKRIQYEADRAEMIRFIVFLAFPSWHYGYLRYYTIVWVNTGRHAERHMTQLADSPQHTVNNQGILL